MPQAATSIEISSNEKTGKVSCTYVSQVSCPGDCVFKSSGCYAEAGFVAITTRRLNKVAVTEDFSLIELARQEAEAINKLSGKRLLRLHVVGDCTTDETAKIVSTAAKDYSKRGGKKVWSYTHGWRTVERSSWQDVSILASVETLLDAEKAFNKGYAVALVVPVQESGVIKKNGFKLLPCPQQLNQVKTCADCKLCTKSDFLLDSKTIITFSTHSGGKKYADQKLIVLQ
jgi:hypothetical protein